MDDKPVEREQLSAWCFKHHSSACATLHLFMYLPRRERDKFSSSPDPCTEPSVRNLVRAPQTWVSEYICTKRFLKCENKAPKVSQRDLRILRLETNQGMLWHKQIYFYLAKEERMS